MLPGKLYWNGVVKLPKSLTSIQGREKKKKTKTRDDEVVGVGNRLRHRGGTFNVLTLDYHQIEVDCLALLSYAFLSQSFLHC